MITQGCGVCMYSTNANTHEDKQHVNCMLDGYKCHNITERCKDFKRNFNKEMVIKHESSKKE